MKASARLTVEADGGRFVVRELRSDAPLTLLPVRGQPVVHLVGSAAGPLGGDELTLTVLVGPRACLTLRGIAASVVLPGPHNAKSHTSVHIELGEGASVDYLPEPTVVTRRATHEATLTVALGEGARFRTRETVVLGRSGEQPGELYTAMHVTRCGRPVLRQRVAATVESLLGKRVLATELSTSDTREAASGEWWSRTRLAAGGTLTTAVADDAVTAARVLGYSHDGR
ncbi:urease accessory protein UreD [Actinophytocola oryzae]|uniref:Urease accessory protein UreD n=1 Tax=Actinophytocola oryzae TaxID=502181 RepID=A0A4R7V2W7_9PSEU|nr:urease accessory protein UreD [Actinophytocola oryzae]TDV41796.1 urease accessory protein [Actinophytocola oryzae]